MKLCTKGRYGARIILDVAVNGNDGPVALKDVAQRQGVPLAYVKTLVSLLTTGGLLRSKRGVGGGVSLRMHPDQIKLKEIIELLEGPTALMDCIAHPDTCERSDLCVTRDIWRELDIATNEILESITLQNMIDRQIKKWQTAGIDVLHKKPAKE